MKIFTCAFWQNILTKPFAFFAILMNGEEDEESDEPSGERH